MNVYALADSLARSRELEDAAAELADEELALAAEAAGGSDANWSMS
jgi:hypothetical protein